MPEGAPPPLVMKLIEASQRGDVEGMAQAAVLIWVQARTANRNRSISACAT